MSKRMVERRICDIGECDTEAHDACLRCGRDACYKHKTILSGSGSLLLTVAKISVKDSLCSECWLEALGRLREPADV